MKFKSIKFLLFLLLLCLYAPNLSATENIDWISGREPLYETDANSPIIGTRWGLAARKDDIQISFRLEVSTDMKKGGWIGDIRAPEKFYVKVYLVDSAGKKYYFKLNGAKAVGQDSEYGGWKKGPETTPQQMMLYDLSWEDIQNFKKAKTVVLNYSSYDSRDDRRDIVIPMDSFSARLGELEASVKNVDGGSRFLMTKEEIDTTPLNDLPASIREHWQDDLKRVSEELSMPVSELHKLSMRAITNRQKDRAKAIKEAKAAKIRKAHQAIYNQEPEWFDINVCPKPDVGYCKNIGKTAYLDDSVSTVEGDRLVGAMALRYGKIYGVVWRSKNSIIRIYPGDVQFDRDPEIYRAAKAEYYYIIKSGNHVKVKPCADVYAKG